MASISAPSPTGPTAVVAPATLALAPEETQKQSSPVQTQKQPAPVVAKVQAAKVEAPQIAHRFSTKALAFAYTAISTLGAMLAYWVCPTAAIAGAIAGFGWSFMEGSRIQETEEARGGIVALIGITMLASLYAATNPGAALTSTLLGLQGAATGFYPLARDFVDKV